MLTMIAMGVVVVAVVFFEFVVFARTYLRHYRSYDPAKELEYHKRGFENDIKDRAERGQEPDWRRYDAEMEKTFYDHEESIRTAAGVALVIGIGGTIVALMVSSFASGFTEASSGADQAFQVIHHLAFALAGSFAGIINNLGLMLGLLGRVDKLYKDAHSALKLHLQQIHKDFPPQLQEAVAFENVMKDVAGKLDEVITGALGRLPDEIGRLDATMREQSALLDSLHQAIGGLKAETSGLVAVSDSLAPVADKLGDAVSQLNSLPEGLKGVLDDELGRWREASKESGDQMLRAVGGVSVEVDKLAQTLSMDEFDKKSERHVEALSTTMGRTLSEHVETMGRVLEQRDQEHGDREHALVQRFIDDQGKITEPITAKMADILQQSVVGPTLMATSSLEAALPQLEGASKQLSETSGSLNALAPALTATVQGLKDLQHEEELRAVLARIGEHLARQDQEMARQSQLVLSLLESRLAQLRGRAQ